MYKTIRLKTDGFFYELFFVNHSPAVVLLFYEKINIVAYATKLRIFVFLAKF